MEEFDGGAQWSHLMSLSFNKRNWMEEFGVGIQRIDLMEEFNGRIRWIVSTEGHWSSL